MVTVLAAVWVWWRGRPAAVPTAGQAMRAHRAYLDALASSARSARPPASTEDAVRRN
jgi:hypothetical protein